jgi:hypothetical protein
VPQDTLSTDAVHNAAQLLSFTSVQTHDARACPSLEAEAFTGMLIHLRLLLSLARASYVQLFRFRQDHEVWGGLQNER